jgi:hypothetical protein
VKLRIRGDSLRLRLSRTEVATLAERGRVEDAITFDATTGAALRYALDASADASAVAAHFADGRITVVLPLPVAHRWTSSEQVSVSAEQPLDAGDAAAGVLTILVEKDFPCAGRDDAENADTFAPGSDGARC